MDYSPVYFELESMLEKNWVVKSLSEFGQQLDQLEEESKISPQEHALLLELYLGRNNQTS
jgi:hypothetical protein